MANYEHGMYEPSDEVRVFDGSEEDEDLEGSRLPLLIVLALLVLAMFAGVVWLAYTQGVARGRGETPVLAAAPGPAKIAPQNPGGANVPYQGFKIYEQPAPPDDQANANASSVPATAPIAAPPAAVSPVSPTVSAAPVPSVVASVPAKPLVAERPPLPPPPLKKAISSSPAPVSVATAAPRPLPGIVAAGPANTPSAAAPLKAAGGYALQIGAYKSEEDAKSAWDAYKARHAALLAGYGPDVQRADLGDKGVWFRLRVAGFSDREVASALCDRLKADGGACFLGK